MELSKRNQVIAEEYASTIFSHLKYDLEVINKKKEVFFRMVHERFTDAGISLRDPGDSRLSSVLRDMHKQMDQKAERGTRYICMYPSSGTQSRPHFPSGSRDE